MAKQQSFEQVSRRCIAALGTAAMLVASVAVLVVLHTMAIPAFAWVEELSKGAVLGFALMVFLGVATNLAVWSAHSHTLAVGHGMIPRWSVTWATYAWFVPVLQFVLPFSILLQRFRSYRVIANKPLRWLQALFVGTVLLWGWMLAGIVPEAKERWLSLVVAATAMCLWRLRGVVVALSRTQLAGERAGPTKEQTSAAAPPRQVAD